jgi:hypothetical protein
MTLPSSSQKIREVAARMGFRFPLPRTNELRGSYLPEKENAAPKPHEPVIEREQQALTAHPVTANQKPKSYSDCYDPDEWDGTPRLKVTSSEKWPVTRKSSRCCTRRNRQINKRAPPNRCQAFIGTLGSVPYLQGPVCEISQQ